jgi:hypothetical protein
MKMSLSGSTAAATITCQVALLNSLRSVATRPPFARRANPGYGAAHGRAAHRKSRHNLYVLTAVPKGNKGALMEIIFEQLSGLLIHTEIRILSLSKF